MSDVSRDKVMANPTNLTKRLGPLLSSPLLIPLAFLIVTFLAYGLVFWRLGFYWDDLPISWIRYQFGPEATAKYFSDSRPVWALLFQLTGNILPLKPAYWQLFGMLWRWGSVWALWLVLEKLFSRRKGLAFLLSLFMLVYPGFNQQWVSYVYSHFFIVLFFLLFSWYLMLRGKTIPAMIFSALNLLMFEYFFALEFVRPLIILKSLQDEPLTKRDRFIKAFKLWFPYLAVIVFAVLYRLLVYSHPGFGYSLTDELARQPVATFTQLVNNIFSSLWVSAVAAWLQAFQLPGPNISGARTTILYAVVVLGAGAVVLFVRRLYDERAESDTKGTAWWLLFTGVILLMLGGVPFWAANVPVSLGFPANRATLSFMLGAAFFLMGLIELLPRRAASLIAMLIISLSAGRQFLWSVDYLRDWQSQKNLFWQMTWRAPGLTPGTMVLINEELQYYADNSLSAALNWIYAPDLSKPDQIPYVLFYPTNRIAGSLPGLQAGLPVTYPYWIGSFTGTTSQALAFYYQPPGCLRLLDPEIDSQNRLIPEASLMREAAALSSSAWITPEATGRMPEVYGPEPPRGWCYYFEQADLARQLGEWQRVVQLGDQAFALADYPNDPVERFVFIEGYAHEGNWARVKELAIQSYKVSPNYVGPLLCRLLNRIDREASASDDKKTGLKEMRAKFSCLP